MSEKNESNVRRDGVLGAMESIATVVRTLTWPAIGVALLIEFHEPLRQVIEILPKKIEAAEKVSAGGLSIEIQKSAEASGAPELAVLIEGLSTEAIDLLLRIHKEGNYLMAYSTCNGAQAYVLASIDELRAAEELERKGLVSSGRKLSDWQYKWDQLLEECNEPNQVVLSSSWRAYVPKKERKSLKVEDDLELRNSGWYKLNDLGDKAKSLIIRAVSKKLGPASRSADDS